MRFSTVKNEQPFTLETTQGDIELKFTKFTIQDSIRRNELIEPVVNNENLTNIEKYNQVNVIRLMCSVKRVDNGDYYFPGSVEDFISLNLENEMINALCAQVDILNPIPNVVEQEGTFDAKKGNSSATEQNS